jgi:hypothetical protein
VIGSLAWIEDGSCVCVCVCVCVLGLGALLTKRPSRTESRFRKERVRTNN